MSIVVTTGEMDCVVHLLREDHPGAAGALFPTPLTCRSSDGRGGRSATAVATDYLS